jgi:serine/threonine protein kinase
MRFQQITAHLMNHVRVNSIQLQIRNGLPMYVKKRRFGVSFVVWCGNRFLSLANSGLQMFVQANEWTQWELHCAQLLYPDRAVPIIDPPGTLVMPEVRGVSLRAMLNADKLEPKVAQVAAREIRRAHQIQCPIYRGMWSHGDMHLDNILYNTEKNQVTLIDFDTGHDVGLDEVKRHADDLNVFLLELVSKSPPRWKEIAFCVLQEYGDIDVLTELSKQLVVPRGIARILWYTRTSSCPLSLIETRLQCLSGMIHQIADTARTRPQSSIDEDDGLGNQL